MGKYPAVTIGGGGGGVGRSWMHNDVKTEFIVIASRYLSKKAAVNTVRVGDCDVSKVSVVRNLGAWFDDQLTV